jgi:protein-tyrosine-phosphatase
MSALETARAVGVDLTWHRAKQLTREMVEAADLVLTMDHYHRERVAALASDAAGRTRLLLEFAGRADAEVEDPIGHSLEFYRRTLDVMMPALEKVATDVRTRLGR